jgi:hypothetical protein
MQTLDIVLAAALMALQISSITYIADMYKTVQFWFLPADDEQAFFIQLWPISFQAELDPFLLQGRP